MIESLSENELNRLQELYNEFFVQGQEKKLSETQKYLRCPFDDHEDHNPSFSLNLNDGVFFCFGCERTGNLKRMQSYKPRIPFDELSEDCIRYLEGRGCDIEIVKNIGVKTANFATPDEVFESHNIERTFLKLNKSCDYLVFPRVGGTVCFKPIDPERDSRKIIFVKGDVKSFFLAGRSKYNCGLSICEGEIDALVLASRGMHNVLAISGSKLKSLDEVLAFLPQRSMNYPIVTLCFDNDHAGKKLLEAIIEEWVMKCHFKLARLRVLKLSEGNDPAEEFLNKEITASDSINWLEVAMNSLMENSRFGDTLGFKDLKLYFIRKASSENRKLISDFLSESINDLVHDRGAEVVSGGQLHKLIQESSEVTETIPLFKTGFRYIDENFKFDSGKFLILCAPSGFGKTTFCLNIMVRNPDLKMGFISLEMSQYELISSLVKVLKGRVFKPNMGLVDGSRLTVTDLRLFKYIKTLQKGGCSLIVIDHVERIQFSIDEPCQKYTLQSKLAFDLSSMCKDLNISIILIGQMLKSNDKMKTIDTFKGSGGLKEACDALLQLDPDTNQGVVNQSATDIRVLRFHKNRFGQSSNPISDEDGKKNKGQRLKFIDFNFYELNEFGAVNDPFFQQRDIKL